MARFAALLVFIAALAAFGGSGAQADLVAPDSAGAVAVSYNPSSAGGVLTIVGGQGLDMESWSADGQPVAAGILNAPITEMAVPIGHVAPGGLALTVRVGGNVLPVPADPDWNWD